MARCITMIHPGEFPNGFRCQLHAGHAGNHLTNRHREISVSITNEQRKLLAELVASRLYEVNKRIDLDRQAGILLPRAALREDQANLKMLLHYFHDNREVKT